MKKLSRKLLVFQVAYAVINTHFKYSVCQTRYLQLCCLAVNLKAVKVIRVSVTLFLIDTEICVKSEEGEISYHAKEKQVHGFP